MKSVMEGETAARVLLCDTSTPSGAGKIQKSRQFPRLTLDVTPRLISCKGIMQKHHIPDAAHSERVEPPAVADARQCRVLRVQ